MTRFVIDCETLLRIAAGEIEVAAEHKLVAPTLIRSQALAALYESTLRGELSAAEGIERVTRINSLKVRFLGDKVLQRTAWRVADQLGWETTFDAEFVALTQLQADAFVTSDRDLARAVSGLVETATIDALRKPRERRPTTRRTGKPCRRRAPGSSSLTAPRDRGVVRVVQTRGMKLWRLARAAHTALDGAGTLPHGGRYSPPGVPVVNFASEAGLAVLVALRYLPGDPAEVPDDYLLGWTEIAATPERVPDDEGEEAVRAYVTRWLEERRSLLAAVRSKVLPEADVVLMNPAHRDAARVPPLATRPFSFAECLHTPPMNARY